MWLEKSRCVVLSALSLGEQLAWYVCLNAPLIRADRSFGRLLTCLSVAITYLQHTDPSLPHYYDTTWSFIRGAACTIDRSFPFIGPHIWHGIIETHVLHHYVSTIPFYHAEKATAAIKPVMGKHLQVGYTRRSLGFSAQPIHQTLACVSGWRVALTLLVTGKT